MAAITAQAVNEFRKVTGLGLMKCKELLGQAGGDMQRALTLAKEQGIKDAGKRAGRVTANGRIEAAFDAGRTAGALAELNCETDFVARNDDFKEFAKNLVGGVLNSTAELGESEALIGLRSRTGENVTIGRTVRFAVPAGGSGGVDVYIHHDQKSGALVQLECEKPATANDPEFRQLIKDVALHALASQPQVVNREGLDQATIDEQKRIFMSQAADKPEAIRGKIAEGKLNSWYAEVALVDQEFVKDMDKERKRKVREVLAELGQKLGDTITATRMARFVVGETASAPAASAADATPSATKADPDT